MVEERIDSPWLLPLERRSQPELRLFCFAHAGASAQAFASWKPYLPPSIELWAIELPGRGPRLHEVPEIEVAPLVEGIVPAIAPLLWSGSSPSHVLVTTSTAGAYLARFEASGDPFGELVRQLRVSSFDVDGTFGPPRDMPGIPNGEGQFVAAAPDRDGFVLVWSMPEVVRFAAFDAGGRFRVMPRDLASTSGQVSQLAITPRTGGFALLFSKRTDQDSAPELFFLALGPGGEEAGQPQLVHSGESLYRELSAQIVQRGDGFGVIFRDAERGAPFLASDVLFARLDAQGSLQGEPVKISATTGRGFSSGGVAGVSSGTLSLIPRSNGFLAGWTEAFSPEDNFDGSGPEKAYAIIRIAELDGSGAVIGGPHSLQSPENDIDQVDPTLLPFADTIAVLWGRGSHIYVCAGCIPDHRTTLVLLDPVTLAPASNIVSLAPTSGGQLNRSAVVVGSSILMTMRLTYHVHDTAGSAAFSCQ